MHVPNAVQVAMQYIDAHACEGVRVADAARHAGVSVPQLSRLFSTHVGKTPTRVILDARVKAATAMLLAGELLARSARRAGFSDQAHLTRAFKRVHHQSPAQFVRDSRKTVQDTLPTLMYVPNVGRQH